MRVLALLRSQGRCAIKVMKPSTEHELFAAAGTSYGAAWEKLGAMLHFPPSFEVFKYGLEQARTERTDGRFVSPMDYARVLCEETAS